MCVCAYVREGERQKEYFSAQLRMRHDHVSCDHVFYRCVCVCVCVGGGLLNKRINLCVCVCVQMPDMSMGFHAQRTSSSTTH